jgi:hypothetical protein
MRRTLVVLFALIAATSLPVVLAQDAVKTPTGFSKASADASAKFERIVLDTPTPENARKWLMALTEEPHVAGTPAEKKVAEWVRDKLKEFGLDPEPSPERVAEARRADAGDAVARGGCVPAGQRLHVARRVPGVSRLRRVRRRERADSPADSPYA